MLTRQDKTGTYADRVWLFAFFEAESSAYGRCLLENTFPDVQVQREFLEKLFGLLEAIVELHASILEFLGQLQNGKFIQCSAETLLQVPHPPLDSWAVACRVTRMAHLVHAQHGRLLYHHSLDGCGSILT